MIFGVGGLHLQPERHHLARGGAPKVDFGAIWEVILEPFGVLGRPYGAVLEPWMVSFVFVS